MKLCFWNGDQMCSALVPFDIGLPGHVWVDAPEDFDKHKRYTLDDGMLTELDMPQVTPERLRVFRVISEDQNPLITDFTILGFRKMSPSYDRGKKVIAQYKCIEKDEVIVEKIFQDVRDENGILTGLQITFNWYSEDNVVRASKTEIVKNFNKFEAETEERKRRYRQFDYLRASAKGTPIETHIETLMAHYQVEIANYQEGGSTSLDSAMVNETDPTINAILAIQMPRNDGLGITTVMKSVQYQIGTLGIGGL